MAMRPGLLWLLGLALCSLGSSHGLRPPYVFPQRRLGVHERRDMQREILAVLGLPELPRPRAPPAASRQPASAPLFMLDLYHAMADDDNGGPPPPHLGRSDLVMSFVNMVEHDHTLDYQEPHWKEFLFDLTQIPAGEAVTAAEFRIYKEPSTHPLNTTLHVSMFEVVQEHSNRYLLSSLSPSPPSLPAPSSLSLPGHSMDPGLAGLLGQQAPRSRQPFMVGFFRASQRPVRTPQSVRPLKKKRQLNKTIQMQHASKHAGIFDEGHGSRGRDVCRRHELYVSFRDLGWLDSVIAPQGYPAYYCAGECNYPMDYSMNSTNHANMQALIHVMKPDVVPKVCCVPTELSPISVLYYDRSNNVILRKERNMVVQACGCH
uniref:TGF-beta family profile domain-containing protein n=1 Tax=Cricetulus griseus TaxID=10029 RepID=A0A8C2N4E1_CRIGR